MNGAEAASFFASSIARKLAVEDKASCLTLGANFHLRYRKPIRLDPAFTYRDEVLRVDSAVDPILEELSGAPRPHVLDLVSASPDAGPWEDRGYKETRRSPLLLLPLEEEEAEVEASTLKISRIESERDRATAERELRPHITLSPGAVNDERVSLWVGRADGQILTSACLIGSGLHYYLADLFVHPEHRSSGLGGAFLSGLISAIRKKGATALLTVPTDDPNVVRFYQKRGFAEVASFASLRWIKGPGRA